MKPVISEVDLSKLYFKAVRKICNCEKLCKRGVSFTTHNDGIILCWNDARYFLFDLNGVLDEGTYTSWTAADEKQFIDYIKERGIYNGVYREIAQLLGKEYQQVKTKGRQLKKRGLI